MSNKHAAWYCHDTTSKSHWAEEKDNEWIVLSYCKIELPKTPSSWTDSGTAVSVNSPLFSGRSADVFGSEMLLESERDATSLARLADFRISHSLLYVPLRLLLFVLCIEVIFSNRSLPLFLRFHNSNAVFPLVSSVLEPFVQHRRQGSMQAA